MKKKRITRREFIGAAATVAGAALLEACAPQATPTPQVITKVETKLVEKVETKIVEVEKLVTPTVAPKPKIINALGVELPADAAPLERQVWNLRLSMDGKYHDPMLSIYDRVGLPECSTLYYMKMDHNLEPQALLAKNCVAVDDTTWRLEINSGHTWSDGEPITAPYLERSLKFAFDGSKRVYDFSWLFEPILNVAECAAGQKSADELGVKALDDYTLEIKTKAACPFMPLLSTVLCASPVHLYEKYGDFANGDPKTALTCGPWKWDVSVPGSHYEYGLNPASTAPAHIRPMLTKLVTRAPITEEGAALAAFLSGELPYLEVGGYQMNASRSDMALVQGPLKDQAYPFPEFTTYYLGFNSIDDKYPFKDNLTLRRAFAYALDVDGIVSTVLAGLARTAYTMLPPGFVGSQPDHLKGYYPYNPARARDMMAEAGYPNGQGLPTLEVWLREPTPALRSLAEAVTKQLHDNLNVQFEIKIADYPTFGAKIKHEMAMYIVPYGMDYYDQSNLISIFSSGGRHPWKSEAFDAKAAEADSCMEGPEVRNQLYLELEKMLVDDVCCIFLCYPMLYYVYDKAIRGPLFNINKHGFIWGQGPTYVERAYFAEV